MLGLEYFNHLLAIAPEKRNEIQIGKSKGEVQARMS